ncbi:MAG: EAL domain-containing protein [Acidisphaera sp.]|nr:EAL domain-containing protein [Acidisphaera sp.]
MGRRFTLVHGLGSVAGTTGTHQRMVGERAAGAVTALAAFAAIAVASTVPAAYLMAAYDRVVGVLEAHANIYAAEVSDEASQSPELWNALLGSEPDAVLSIPATSTDSAQIGETVERYSVKASTGRVLIDAGPDTALAWPRLAVDRPVMQNGHPLGSVRITRSFRPQAVAFLVLALGSVVVGLMLLYALRLVPLRLLRDALDRIAFLAGHDALTGLPNRALLADRVEQALLASRRAGTSVAIYCLDLDRFKDVNDTLGHAAGDTLLRTVATRLLGCVREGDTVARLGGDEFAVVQPDLRDPSDAESVASRLVDIAREPIELDGQQVLIGVSVGIALSDGQGDGNDLVQQADVALYQAKNAGRGGFCFFEPAMNAHLHQRRATENALRAALTSGEIAVHYQPQIDLADGRIVGAEALMRWTRRDGLSVSPAEFIPLAEETGLICPLGAWLLNQACREAASWPAPMSIAINVSPVQLRAKSFPQAVQDALASSGLDPHRLELEVTEGILLNDTDEMLTVFDRLRGLGVRFAIDDFGTGYSSLAYLQKFRFDKLKIDKSFVQNIGTDPNAAAIVRAVLGLGAALGTSTNAEGVEKQEQEAVLRAHGCREVQGYLYWKPMPAAALRELIGSPPSPGPVLSSPAMAHALALAPS